MNRPGANGNGAANGECGCCGGNRESSPRCAIELIMFLELLMLLWGSPQGLVTPARV